MIDRIKEWWFRNRRDAAWKKHKSRTYFKYAAKVAKFEAQRMVKEKLQP